MPGELLLCLRKLAITAPDGSPLVRDFDLDLRAGEVVVLLGPSGGGKTAFGRALVDRDELSATGFRVTFDQLDVLGRVGFVPQRGALADHVDVADNLRLAIRRNPEGGPDSDVAVRQWLDRLDLDGRLAEPGRLVTELSGGQAQRLAVARALASGRQLLFLDEPSVGLDSARVRKLARLIRSRAEEDGVALVIVTHDLTLAAGVADRLYLLEPGRKVVQLFADGWPGPFDSPSAPPERAAGRQSWLDQLETLLIDHIGMQRSVISEIVVTRRMWPAVRGWLGARILPFALLFTVLGDGLLLALRRPADSGPVLGRVLRQALARPLLFYAFVSLLLGFTLLYTLIGVAPMGLRPERALALLGNAHIVALMPPLAAILFVAASGNAVSGWIGGANLTRQIAALEAIGMSRRVYLWPAAWWGLFLSALVVIVLFGLGLTLGGVAYTEVAGIEGGWEVLTGDWLDARPERRPWNTRALALGLIYAGGIAADVVAAGTLRKDTADDVVRAMTGSVVRCTLWVVVWELASVWFVRGLV